MAAVVHPTVISSMSTSTVTVTPVGGSTGSVPGSSLSQAVRSAFTEPIEAGKLTIPAGDVAIDFRAARATWNEAEYQLSPLGPAAQELILAGGLEELTRKRLGLG